MRILRITQPIIIEAEGHHVLQGTAEADIKFISSLIKYQAPAARVIAAGNLT